MNRMICFLFLICVLAQFYCSNSNITETARGPVLQGHLAPNFSLKDSTGKQQSLHDFRGKVVLLNFWATWCPPCREEMPSMEALYQQMDKNEFAILALSVDDSWASVNQFIRKNGFALPVYADFDKRISSMYGTFMYPETYILDKNGKVAYKVVGPTDWTSVDMMKFLRVLVLEKTALSR